MTVYLGVDWGRARVGVAVSDESGVMAHPLETLHGGSPADVAAALMKLAVDRGAGAVVLGLPLNMDGSEGDSARAARALAAALESQGLRTILRDERLSTWRAEAMLTERGARGRAKKERRDRAAAAVILQGYLDEQRGGGA